jgi:hypothetical protein
MTNVSILELCCVPEHLVIIGGSYIGLEFAQMYRRFGAAVTVVERGPRLARREDEDISTAIKEILEAEGIQVVLDAAELQLSKLASSEKGFELRTSGGAASISGTDLLVATGRRPNTDDLGLEHAGVQTDAGGWITVNDRLRTNVEHIWAMGDCNGRGAFTHTSYNDFEIVAANLLEDDPRRVSDRITTYALYIDPPLGQLVPAHLRRALQSVVHGAHVALQRLLSGCIVRHGPPVDDRLAFNECPSSKGERCLVREVGGEIPERPFPGHHTQANDANDRGIAHGHHERVEDDGRDGGHAAHQPRQHQS